MLPGELLRVLPGLLEHLGKSRLDTRLDLMPWESVEGIGRHDVSSALGQCGVECRRAIAAAQDAPHEIVFR